MIYRKSLAALLSAVCALLMAFGTLSILFALLCAVVFLPASDTFGIVLGLICLVLGIFLFRFGKKTMKLSKLSSGYAVWLTNDPRRSLSQLACQIDQPVNQVCANMEKMIKLGLFPGAAVNRSASCLEIAGLPSTAASQSFSGPRPDHGQPEAPDHPVNAYRRASSADASQANPSSRPKPQQKTVTCPNCGASNVVTAGAGAECEFCGSHLSA